MEIFKLFGRILVDDKEAQKSLSKTDKNAKSLGKRFGGMLKTAAKWGAGLAAAAGTAGVALFGLANKATQTADAIAKGAERVGVSTDFYQEMDFWASQNGLSHEKMEKAVGRFNQRLGQAVNGNEKYASALQQVGVDLDAVRNGQLSTEEAYAQTIQRLSEMENEQDKVNLATEIFGTRMARDMLPALNEGSLSIEEAREKAQELGLVLAEDQLYAAEAFQDSWDRIKRSLGTVATQIGLSLMPIFQSMMDFILDKVIPTTMDLWAAFRSGEGVMDGIRNVFNELTNGEGITMFIDMAREALSDFVTWLSSEGIPMLMDWIIQSREMFFNAVMELFPVIIEAGVAFIPQLIEWLAQEFIPQILNFLIESIPMLLDTAIQLFNSLIEAVNTVLPQLLNVLLTVVLPNLLTAIMDMLPNVLDSAVQLFTSFLDAVMEILPQLLTLLLGTVLPNLLTTILDMTPQLLQTAIQVFFALLDAVRNVLPQLLTLLITVVLPNILRTLIRMMPKLLSTAVQVFMMLLEGLIRLVPKIISFITFDLIPSIIRAFGKLDMIQIGKDIIRGLWYGITSLGGWIKSKVRNFVGEIGHTIKSFFGISSPSKLMMEYGVNIVEGLEVGMEEEEQELTKSSQKVAQSVVNPMNDIDPDIHANNGKENRQGQQEAKQPVIIQLMATNSRELARWLIDDINELLTRV
ncbi:phage-related protein [Melghiribacillus thermohalophilus]|uniref:Phage-related protein n=1 Tax=Melghiribacillus thermohalophilus TaxID=1324956 RepID=A0A4R3N3A4_9BACI|nr:hypothetical protein [Melghiribacillus thermohalophilus]TCT23395.1 phage-related protein [Melghiribacillus thermohalophilus]